MALSLLCKDCNTLLRNVQEAQAHNDATGHANFEESTKPVSFFTNTKFYIIWSEYMQAHAYRLLAVVNFP